MGANHAQWARNLKKEQLGGVIFGCTDMTITECLSKQLFGLPGTHMLYVKNIEPGLPLFLFNYNDKKLHGIYEAASPGTLNIDRYAWTPTGSERTMYPAQVRVFVKLQCQPLPESLFKPIIIDNYYTPNHFRFELDHSQASKLQSKFSSLAIHARTRIVIPKNPPVYKVVQKNFVEKKKTENKASEPTSTWADDVASKENSHDLTATLGTSYDMFLGNYHSGESSAANQVAISNEKDLIYMKLKELALAQSSVKDNVQLDQQSEEDMLTSGKTNSEHSLQSNDDIIAKLCGEIEELKAFKQDQTRKMEGLEKKLAEAELEIHRLVNRCMMLESVSNTAFADEKSPDEFPLNESILVVGGFDDSSWLSTVHAFSPSLDRLRALKPMSSGRGHTAIAQVNKEIYVIGGGIDGEWCDTVESYNIEDNQWTLRQPLKTKNGCLAGAALNGKIYALGGGNCQECFSDVEMLDLDIGYWIPARSMKQKRFGLGAVELNGSIYAVGGYDGEEYLNSAERFDPRDHGWTSIASMDKKKGCHSLVVLNEKIYAIGGCDGISMVTGVEMYDPRAEKWMDVEPMNHCRGYMSTAVHNESIYVMGGGTEDKDFVETVEYYREGQGWQESYLRGVGKRCFASTIVLRDGC